MEKKRRHRELRDYFNLAMPEVGWDSTEFESGGQSRVQKWIFRVVVMVGGLECGASLTLPVGAFWRHVNVLVGDYNSL